VRQDLLIAWVVVMSGVLCPMVRADAALPLVEPVDLGALSPDDFADDELDLPYLLAHLHRVANAVVSEGELRGYIDLPVWRPVHTNHPGNARVLENHLALAFFYCTDRPWNPYFGDPAVRARLEAILQYWLSRQNAEGLFSEYRMDDWNLAATGFGVMTMAETLRVLRDGPPIDAQLHQRVIDATRKALEAILTLPAMYQHARRFSNQYTSIWGPGQLFLQMYPDERLSTTLLERMQSAVNDFHSPAGYPYEREACDWAYTLDTHHANMGNAWRFAPGTAYEQPLIESDRRWLEWLSYNAVREPDDSYFTLNSAIESRRTIGGFTRWSTPLAEQIELARAFAALEREAARGTQRLRQQLERRWPQVDELTTYQPHRFIRREYPQWYPTREQRDEAIRLLPYLARDRFTHQRHDPRTPVTYSFIRRPGYYATFTSGTIVSEQQRYGLGLLWHPGMGSVLQSQSNTHDAVWGTMIGGRLVEATPFDAEPRIDNRRVMPQPGNHDLGDGDFTITYDLPAGGTKSVTLTDIAIVVRIRHGGEAVEQFPLLLRDNDALERTHDGVTLRRGRHAMILRSDPPARVELLDGKPLHGPWRLAVVRLHAKSAFRYEITFDAPGD
jgi:hypothetical protein